nr:MAG TPA: hypothetical protein [Caudoviricetes sp.]
MPVFSIEDLSALFLLWAERREWQTQNCAAKQ